MDDARFDRIAATLATAPSRRRLLGALLGTALTGLLGQPETAARRRRRRNCPPGRPRCGAKCCQQVETCQRGRCVHHCEDGRTNRGETNVDCGGACRGIPNKKCGRLRSCVINEDCQSGICFDIAPDRRVCGDCRIDSDCDTTAVDLGPRCVNNLCKECGADFDCPAARPFCVALNRCFGNEPCACGQCRQGQEETDCPDPGKPVCVDGVCKECGDDVDCQQGQTCGEEGVCFGSCRIPGQLDNGDADSCCSGRSCDSDGIGSPRICCDFSQNCFGPNRSCSS